MGKEVSSRSLQNVYPMELAVEPLMGPPSLVHRVLDLDFPLNLAGLQEVGLPLTRAVEKVTVLVENHQGLMGTEMVEWVL